MDDDARSRLRERLNFPDPTPDAGAFVSPGTGPDIPTAESATVRPPADPGTGAGDAADATLPAAAGLSTAVGRLADVVERLDGELRATRADIERLHDRLDRIEHATGDLDELAGLEAVRRTVSASHRALAAQLARMLDDLQAGLGQADDDVLVGAHHGDG